MQNNNFDLDAPLLTFSGGDALTVKETFEGILILGGIGAGKSTSSGAALALRMLAHGYAGLVLTAKPEEAEIWRAYCRATNREQDLVIVEPGGNEYFNFIGYECTQKFKGVSVRQNVVSLLDTVIGAGQQGSGIAEDAQFWTQARSMTISSVVGLSLLAYGTVNARSLYDIAMCAPKEDEGSVKQDKQPNDHFTTAIQIAEKNVQGEVNAFLANLPPDVYAELQKKGAVDAYALKHVPNYRSLKQITQFFQRSYKKLPSKTRSSIEFMVAGFLYQLLSEPFYSLFCSDTPSTFTPESALDKGAIIVLNLPTKLHHDTGRAVQIAIKYCFQRAWEKRDTKANNRPAFIFADESPIFLHALDADFQSTARSSMIATVYLAQNLPGYFANMGGNAANYKVKQFLGTLATKIFHSNADADTNKYASELIGEETFEDDTQGVNWGRDVSFSRSSAERLRHAVRPEEFFLLATGGARHGFSCEAIIHRQGALFGGKAYKKVRFKQSLIN